MIYNFIYPLSDIFSPFNLFRYLTFRSIAAFLTALVISFLIGGSLIRWLRSKQTHGQPIREDGNADNGIQGFGGLVPLFLKDKQVGRLVLLQIDAMLAQPGGHG